MMVSEIKQCRFCRMKQNCDRIFFPFALNFFANLFIFFRRYYTITEKRKTKICARCRTEKMTLDARFQITPKKKTYFK